MHILWRFLRPLFTMREIDRRKFLKLLIGSAGTVATSAYVVNREQDSIPSSSSPTPTWTPPEPEDTTIPEIPTPTPTARPLTEVSPLPDPLEEARALRKAHVNSRSSRPVETPLPTLKYTLTNRVWEGIASYYSEKGCLGCRPDLKMANGEIFDENKLTLAFMRVPLNSQVLVENMKTRLSVVAKVTDRGGFEPYGRIADLSLGLRNKISGEDLTPVRITLLQALK